MPKKVKVRYDDMLSFESLIASFERASRGRKNKKEIVLFSQNLESNIIQIYNELKNLTYIPSKYRQFTIYEPKERIIKSLPIKDRVIHQWYVEAFLKPYMVPKFISDTYACIIGRGTHKCFKKMQYYMRCMERLYGNYYIIKLDIKKYFFNIDRNILYNILKENFKDKKMLKLAKIILGDFSEKGIPIGNYTSQYFANIYLSKLDYFIKFDLNLKYYCRYMDDFIILVPDKETAKNVYMKVKKFLKSELDLELNKKSKYYPSKYGCNFCGFIVFENYILLRKRFKKSFKKKMSIKNNIFVVSSLLGHLKWANSYNFLKKYFFNKN